MIEKEDIVAFTIRVLSEIDPDTNYNHNWHLELICKYLLEVYCGNIKRLIINVPPRSLKSVCISVAFPAWILANKSSEKIIAVSYSKILSQKHSMDCRKIMLSNWYSEMTNTRIKFGENEKNKFTTMKNGYRFSTSTNGTLTGEGGNIIIIDDPQNPVKIHNKSERNKVNSWFDNVLISRLNNKNKGKIILVMQRLHEDDLTSHLINKPNSPWEILSIPAIENQNRIYEFQGNQYIYRKDGSILHQDRDNAKIIANIIDELGTHVFSAQYQQNPAIDDGIIKAEWFDGFDANDVKMEKIYYSIDTAFGLKHNNDYTIIMKIGKNGNLFYIVDIIRKKMTYPVLKKLIVDKLKNEKITGVFIEDKNIGSSLIQEIRTETTYNIIGINPKLDKISRIFSCLGILESKRVLINKNQKWNDEFIKEITNIPNSAHDDQIDALTQFLNWDKNSTETKIQRRFRISTI